MSHCVPVLKSHRAIKKEKINEKKVYQNNGLVWLTIPKRSCIRDFSIARSIVVREFADRKSIIAFWLKTKPNVIWRWKKRQKRWKRHKKCDYFLYSSGNFRVGYKKKWRKIAFAIQLFTGFSLWKCQNSVVLLFYSEIGADEEGKTTENSTEFIDYEIYLSNGTWRVEPYTHTHTTTTFQHTCTDHRNYCLYGIAIGACARYIEGCRWHNDYRQRDRRDRGA